MSLLELDSVGVAYGATPILEGVTLRLEPGEVLGLVGGSGSGKSTVALAIARLLAENARVTGHIRLDGDDLLSLAPAALDRVRGARIGIVFQEPMAALNPLMTAGRQVAEVVRRHTAAGRAEAAAAAHAALARVALPDHADRYPHELSGGQRQRVAIAIATVLRPRLLIADEPTTALDRLAEAGVLDLLVRAARQDGAGLLLITHDLAVVAERADRVAVLDRGRVVEDGPVARLAAPRHAVTRALVAAHTAPPPAPPPLAGAILLEGHRLVRDFAARRAHPFAAAPRFRALDRVDLTLARGERLGIAGASGSGKSTLLRLLLALDTATSGEVRIDGHAFAPGAPRALRRIIQPVFQDPQGSFDPRWSVERIVAEPLALDPPPPAHRRQRVLAALAAVGLEAGHAARAPHQLSGGQRQRVAIARALVANPSIVVLDEAVSALDPRIRATILALLDRLSRDRGLAIILVSHDLGVVAQATDRLIVLEAGVVVEEGRTREILAAPAHPHTRALVAATPSLERALAPREGRP